jgi:prepilin-type N-terminal cleavage/methylation domain-containing protein
LAIRIRNPGVLTDRQPASRRGGFTLVELTAAAVIVGIIFSGIAALRSSQTDYARKTQSDRAIANIQEALSCYLFFHGDEPESLKDLSVEKLIQRGFLLGENKSPWNTPYKLAVRDSSVIAEVEPPFVKKGGK